MNTSTLLLLLAPPALMALASAAAGHGDRDTAWRRAEWAAALSTGAGAAALAWLLWAGPISGLGLRLDGPGAVVAVLVGFIGWVIVRFSHRYLQGEANERRYLRLLGITLAAVFVVLMADHLLLLAAAWITTSLTLHGLLRFFNDRPAARLAAHKKFLAGRIADASLLGAVALFGAAFGTLSLDTMLAMTAADGLPPLAQAGMVLLVITALLKCAQMPLHGWLIQVMEAPTPVSALLHAGVVNLGGFVLIRFSPLLAEAPWAQGMLAVVATLTVVMAVLVMGTRISVKVNLAWSTVAQMGFMLLQVALGLPYMALLHLVAHSLYKAHAFLSAGGVVQRQQGLRLVTPAAARAAQTPLRWFVAAVVSLAAVIATGLLTGSLDGPAPWLAGTVLALALVPLVAAGHGLRAGAALASWFVGHTVFALLFPAALLSALTTPIVMVIGVGAALALLFVIQATIVLAPGAAWVRSLHPWAYGGFFVDERVSAVLLRRWPVPALPTAAPAPTLAGARS